MTSRSTVACVIFAMMAAMVLFGTTDALADGGQKGEVKCSSYNPSLCPSQEDIVDDASPKLRKIKIVQTDGPVGMKGIKVSCYCEGKKEPAIFEAASEPRVNLVKEFCLSKSICDESKTSRNAGVDGIEKLEKKLSTQKCQSGTRWDIFSEQCITICKGGQWDEKQMTCNCPAGQVWNDFFGKCESST